MESWNSGIPASKYIVAHIKRCNLCRNHDRQVSHGVEYTPKKLAVFVKHIRAVKAAIKLALEDEEVLQKL
ncbi:hypothetical protein LCGC14_1298610 [marine sediment metagenome]|uniref:Uncharacterized protein n=2 Tax=marine sediment metagenome TaxID=412755 RepID=A0A0F9NT71_9ZZZZ